MLFLAACYVFLAACYLGENCTLPLSEFYTVYEIAVLINYFITSFSFFFTWYVIFFPKSLDGTNAYAMAIETVHLENRD